MMICLLLAPTPGLTCLSKKRHQAAICKDINKASE